MILSDHVRQCAKKDTGNYPERILCCIHTPRSHEIKGIDLLVQEVVAFVSVQLLIYLDNDDRQ